ncbi:zinc-binding metallopeptidase family protein [Paracoccus chinensis]|uniref:Zinc-ribbon domain-containing protein n=1 Tax=Paracoccus chinensis TaxID=525640 RepID=A0A1G9LLA4_9RHOB|nr:putative zinc-binding peptidase [Paracoccus chinensis]SDL62779.1 hypothetical protein SAMN04487971_11542 [Paracoccus chinensis]
MQLFECQNCGQALYFENRSCERCGHRLGYVAAQQSLVAIEPEGELWRPLNDPGARYRFCRNADHDVCNWLVAADAPGDFCEACRHNRMIPDLSDPANLLRWRRLEDARHRLFYSLIQFGLPLATRAEHPEGLAFDMLADPEDPDAPKVLTGHDAGLITINIAEADDAERESRREGMSELYRTLLGHFRHEVGHYYWDRLVRDGDPGTLARFRELFGDEREDYAEALQRHYDEGPRPDWRDSHISAYASSHPWEDFAETWAHYLHIVDTLGTASAYGLSLRPSVSQGEPATPPCADPYRAPDIEQLMAAWTPLTLAVNSLNRSMGQPDLYPFVLSPPVVTKLGFVHRLIRSAGEAAGRGAGEGANHHDQLAPA